MAGRKFRQTNLVRAPITPNSHFPISNLLRRAMHFAAGSNSVEAVRILSAHGADLSIEAVNGYTPLQWAMRLQNKEVAEELRKRTCEREAQMGGWMSRKPLSVIASRFFALIPSH